MTRRRSCFSRILCSATILAATAFTYESAHAQSTNSDTHAHAKRHKSPTKTKVSPKAATTSTASGVTSAQTKASAVSQARSDAAAPAAPSGSESIIVTGSLISDPNLHSASPMTQISVKDMKNRGLKTVTDALQLLTTNGAGNLTNSFSANGAFAAGASAPSLRGLSTDSTLTLMDGQRLSYYPLSDDGERNFVDTNWMPQSIMQRIDVLNDGGSATYGADAVAGVINMVTRDEIQGVEANAEGGLSQRGDSGHQRLYATFGHGDLDRDGYNFYINSEYQQDDALYNRQLQSPYNTGDLTSIGGTNGNTNVLQNGVIQQFGATPYALVRPSNGGTSGVGAWQLLNSGLGCGNLGGVVTGSATTGDHGQSQACPMNSERYAMISPSLRRINATLHFTAKVTQHSELTAMFTYSQALSQSTGAPSAFRTQTVDRTLSTLGTAVPVLLPNGQQNPNNILGVPEEILGTFPNPTSTSQFSQNYRGSVRYQGWEPSNWGSDWKYNVNFVGMNTGLQETYTGTPNIPALQQAILDGSYNFVDQSLNSQAEINKVMPNVVLNARSQEYSGEMSASKGLTHLPGGDLTVAIGGNIRYEALHDPSVNPDPQQTGLNPFHASGSRWVESGFFEVALPFVKMFDMDVSGRYDNYSTGEHHFSPKVGANFHPFKELTVRGTFSRGFRIPSFAETGGSNIGYTTYAIQNQNWINQHLNSDGTPDSYARSYSLGQNTSGNTGLKPEISTNYTGGFVFHPTDWVSLSVDYYYIKKTNYIAPNPISPAQVANDWVDAEMAGTQYNPPAGVNVIPEVEDTQHPGAPARPAIINLGYVNTRSLMTDGVDLELTAQHRLPGALHDILWYSKGELTYVRNYNLTLPNGQVQHFAGTIGPYSAVSASGTPRWRANWSNTFTWKNLSVTPTVYYTSGYKTVAEDYYGAGASSCAYSLGAQNNNPYAPSQCHVKNFWDVDLTVSYQATKRLNLYANVYNLLGFRAPYDFATYGSYLYNSSWASKGVVLRSFQFGATLTL
ncbi:TonB-dependent receptor plug domain-containing protein [Brytella acorum]|uniref:TonB-dependent receptor n=1 Tax=Brytella acorum TaxID=2959299 RepID=A0AA35XYG0_9PROT|nr:TonB-dependent receptor [Brytella acorum]MDF3625701.1 TonB-dependent receptor [Brytella acorum]CAI9121330.1 TonB-dependent receptor [Brytella acorum]